MSREELNTRLRELLSSREPESHAIPRAPEGGLSLFEPPSPEHRFLPSLPAHLEQALSTAAHFMTLANARPGEEGLAAVLDAAKWGVRLGDPEWVRYALRLFLAHHPEGRALTVPPLHERAPHLVLPSRRTMPPRKGSPGVPGAEVWLDYFREDTGLNEAVETWRVRYPAAGHPDPAQPSRRVLPARHAEAFWHTHQQLLARYDTERLSFGMPRTAPLQDFTAPLNEAYDSRLPGFAPRPPGLSLQGVPGYSVEDHATRRDRLCAAASSGLLWHGDTPIDIENVEQLAHTVESTPESLDGEAWRDPRGPHGAYHHLGELLVACLHAPRDTSRLPGVLASPATAARDPLFYRWHRHVDDILDAWRSTHEAPHDLSEQTPVRMRAWMTEGPAPMHQSPDLLLCLDKDVPGMGSPDFDGQRWGEEQFGGEHWDGRPPSFPMTTHVLRTHLAQRPVRLPDGSEVLKPRLEHEPFSYFLRMENLLPREQRVTVRIHLVAEPFVDERRMWMEMDCFVHTLRPSERAVLFRPSHLATVVRERGWPAHLLLPRGRREGMLFRFQVTVTGEGQETETSGEWGYPFNRPFPPGQRIVDLSKRPDVATRNIWLIHEEG
ncbi:tyrosinase family protein [Cystobacter fuscus]|uniref:tyrosinase family protein n=1 Tax=Cystobacter fuscus TaxID=43 RepID=UPI002B322DD7|nr:hypothetical protein F0U63_21160 [Cystobacter fuscus]